MVFLTREIGQKGLKNDIVDLTKVPFWTSQF
jgi:hypothetical protein